MYYADTYMCIGVREEKVKHSSQGMGFCDEFPERNYHGNYANGIFPAQIGLHTGVLLLL